MAFCGRLRLDGHGGQGEESQPLALPKLVAIQVELGLNVFSEPILKYPRSIKKQTDSVQFSTLFSSMLQRPSIQ